MTSLGRALAAWPALAGGSLSPQISYELGVWGKLPGSRSDYRWIATTSAFPGEDQQLEKQLQLGSEDTPRRATHWRSLGDLCLAMTTYPSGSIDAAGRSGFLEKQVFAWRRAETPAALGALALLPRVAKADSGIWKGRQISVSDDDMVLLSPADHEPFQVTEEELQRIAATGLDELVRTVSEDALAELYAHLLAGHRAVPLSGLEAPLGPEALAALLLPLPRTIADGLSLAGWLPSQRISDAREIQSCWNAALAGLSSIQPAEAPAAEHQEQARRLARAVLSKDPAQVAPRPPRTEAGPVNQSIELALWGPSSAGKTALLAQLYLNNQSAREWDAHPDPESEEFFKQMRHYMLSRRMFPPASSQTPTWVVYRFRHRSTGVKVTLRFRDQAGSEFTSLTESVRQHLAEANGVILLLECATQGTELSAEVLQTLDYLKREGIDQDDRPIAVCLSKVDLLIKTVGDLQDVSSNPDSFISRYDRMELPSLLESRNCTNCRFFPVSAAGVRSRYGVVKSVVYYDENLRPRIGPGGKPINVMEPFIWLLNQVTGR